MLCQQWSLSTALSFLLHSALIAGSLSSSPYASNWSWYVFQTGEGCGKFLLSESEFRFRSRACVWTYHGHMVTLYCSVGAQHKVFCICFQPLVVIASDESSVCLVRTMSSAGYRFHCLCHYHHACLGAAFSSLENSIYQTRTMMRFWFTWLPWNYTTVHISSLLKMSVLLAVFFFNQYIDRWVCCSSRLN